MKNPSIISFLITLLLATTLYTHGIELVKDTDGNPLRVDQKYFIQPIKSKGSGIVPAATTLNICPLRVTETIVPYQPGLPVMFIVPKGTNRDIEISSTEVNIEFQSNIWPFCNDFANSKLWTVKEPAVVIGGKVGSPISAFKIEKYNEGYKLMTPSGKTVGLTDQGFWFNAPELLVTKDETKFLQVKFKKVDEVPTATTSTSPVEKMGLRMFPF